MSKADPIDAIIERTHSRSPFDLEGKERERWLKVASKMKSLSHSHFKKALHEVVDLLIKEMGFTVGEDTVRDYLTREVRGRGRRPSDAWSK